MLENNHTACITIYNPRRLIHHPSNFYQLQRYIIVAKPQGGKEVVLTTSEATFSENSVEVPVTLPPQLTARSGEVMVGAEYGNGVVVYSKTDTVEDWPHYGKPFTKVEAS